MAERVTGLARLAGALYLAIIAFGLSGELAVRAMLVVPGDASATSANIAGAEGLFRAGILADAAMAVCDVGLAVVLYLLLRSFTPGLALAAMVFRLVQAAILGAGLTHLNATLLHLDGGAAAGVMTALQSHAFGYDSGLIFFGVNCLLMGALLRRVPGTPRVLGPAIAAAGLVYLTGSGLRILAPDWATAFQPAYLLPLLAELWFAIWLLSRAGTVLRLPAQVASAPAN